MEIDVIKPILEYAFKANHCAVAFSFYPPHCTEEDLTPLIDAMSAPEALARADVLYLGSWSFIENTRIHYPNKLVCVQFMGKDALPNDEEGVKRMRSLMPAVSAEFVTFCLKTIPPGGLYTVAMIGELGSPKPPTDGPPPPQGILIGGQEVLDGIGIQSLCDGYPYVCFDEDYLTPEARESLDLPQQEFEFIPEADPTTRILN